MGNVSPKIIVLFVESRDETRDKGSGEPLKVCLSPDLRPVIQGVDTLPLNT